MRNTVSSLLTLLFFTVPRANALITCKQCRIVFGLETCDADCTGDACFYTITFPTIDTRLETRNSGCILGELPATLGCRMNQDGQRLCLCDTEGCNARGNDTATAVEKLKNYACENTRVHPSVPPTTFYKPCAASFCAYEKTECISQFGNQLSYSSGCSHALDFDLFNSNSRFFYYPDSCSVETASRGQRITTCYTDNNEVNITEVAVPEPTPITCYTGHSAPFLPIDPYSSGNCTGQLCVLMVTRDLAVHRGCMSLLPIKETTTRIMKPGYYKDIDGREQWVCDVEDCNANITALVHSWPADVVEAEEKVNLTMLSPAYQVNAARTTPPPPMEVSDALGLTSGCYSHSFAQGACRFSMIMMTAFLPRPYFNA